MQVHKALQAAPVLVRGGVGVQDFACKAMQRKHAWLFFLKRQVFSGRYMRFFFAGLRGLSAHENLTLFRCIFCPVLFSGCSVRPEPDVSQDIPVILCIMKISSAAQMN